MTTTISDLIEGSGPTGDRPARDRRARGPRASRSARTAPAAAVDAWAAPRVNLLPPEVTARRAVRRNQRAAAVAAGAAVLAIAAAWGLGASRAASEQELLDAASARVTALQTRQAEYAAAPRTIAQVEAARTARATAMAEDVRWSAYVDSLTAALPAASWLEGLQTTAAGADPAAAAAAATTSTSTGAAVIGTVTISAKSTSYDDVAAYLDALASVPGTADPYLTASTRDGAASTPVVTYSVTAQVTADALSHRFDRVDPATAPTTAPTTEQEG